MLSTIQRPIVAQLTAEQALVIARERFPNLTATGMLGTKHTGPPIDPGHVEIAMKFLAQCRKSKKPAVHSFDLRAAIGNGVSQGAVIAAAIALGFDVRGWIGSRMFFPGAMVGVNSADVRRVAMITAK
jgi:hypothetical protein